MDCDAVSVSDILPRLKNLIHPIHTLPPEILGQILYQVCCSNHEFQSSFSPADQRWALCYVSRSWREVVVSSPELWSVFHINLRKDPFLMLEPAVTRRAFDLFMKRSSQHPLDLVISMRGTHRPRSLDENVRYVRLHLCGKAARWRRVTFILSHMDDIAETMAMLSTACSEFPLLLEIAFGVDAFGVNSDDVPAELKFPFPSPRLRRVRLNSVFVQGLPWEQLTELTLESVVTSPASVGRCLDDLAVAQHLDSLFLFEDAFGSEFSPPNPRIVTLPSVHTLCMKGALFFLHLSLPKLRHLHIVGDARDTISTTVNAFLSRSGCAITSIHLQYVRGQEVPLILSSSPYMDTLTSLIIKGSFSQVFMPSEGVVDICAVLSRIGEDASFLPCLKDLSVEFYTGEEVFGDISIWDALEERSRTMRGIEVVVRSVLTSVNGYIPPDNAADADGRYWPMTIYNPYNSRPWKGPQRRLKNAGLCTFLSVVRMWKSSMGRVLEDRNLQSDRPSFDYIHAKDCTFCWDCEF